MSRDHEPISDDELPGLFDSSFADRRQVVLAVSGGPDSTALMHLMAAWRTMRRLAAPELSVLTIDHGLRLGSAGEASAVAGAALLLGLPHAILTWTGPKPTTGVQAAARCARFRLIDEHMRRNGLGCLALAHTADDQAETLLMRLARGSGVDGLAAMRTRTSYRGYLIARPLLGVAKARLLATLRARGIGWVEDPGNDSARFERGRLRQAAPSLAAAGLSREPLGLAARRLGRASAALEAMAATCMAGHPDKLRVDPLGYAEVDWNWLRSLPEDIRLRILARLIHSIGGSKPLSLGRLETMTEARGWELPAGRTLAGALIRRGRAGVAQVIRDAGRSGLPAVEIVPGGEVVWDNRFKLSLANQVVAPARVAALGAGGLAFLDRAGLARPAAPARAVATLPALWRHERLIAAPLLNYFSPEVDAGCIACEFCAWPSQIPDRW